MPTTRQFLIFAICPTTEPTAPAAAETTTISPGFGWPVSRSPKYAVIPGHAEHAEILGQGAILGSTLVIPRPSLSAYSCTPNNPET
jgi:hypothetical protein